MRKHIIYYSFLIVHSEKSLIFNEEWKMNSEELKNLQAVRLKDFLVAGAGLEPRDLRVMSPTSYLTAPPRIKWVRLLYYLYIMLSTVFRSANARILSILPI